MLARQVVLLTSSESFHPSQLPSRQQSTAVNPLAATFIKNRGGGGVMVNQLPLSSNVPTRLQPPFVLNRFHTLPSSVSCNSFACHWVEKSLHLCLAGLRIRWFDPIAESSELPKHLRSAELLRSFGDRWAPFFVTDSLVQDQPNQPALSMGDGSDSLIVSQARD